MNELSIAGVPRVPGGMLSRAHLLDRIGATPLTVIRAPGGRGKTVLMAQWVAANPCAGAWITVEPDIGERAAFWTAIARAMCVPLPGTERATLLDAFRAVGQPVVVIVDDAHELRDPEILEDMLAILRAVPNVSMIIGTRTRSELEAPGHALTLDITIIEPEDLLLTADEIAAFVGDRAAVPELLAASGGSPLLLRAILAGSSSGVRPGASAQAVVRDHLRAVFRTGPDLAAFAMATAIPDDIDVPAATHLAGVDAATAIADLERLEAAGLVMQRDEAGTDRFRYHALVRDALREQLHGDHPDEFRRRSALASAEAEQRGLFLPALRHAVDAEEYARASDVVLHGGFTLLRSAGAAAILQRVPVHLVARLPFVAVVLGLAANARGDRLRALQLLTMALAASRVGRGRQRVAERAGLALVESSILRITGRAGDSATAARRMLGLLEEAAPADLEEIADQLDSYRYQAAISLFRAGFIREARLAAERVGISAHALADASPEHLGAASLVALVDAARGEVVAAAAMVDRIDAAPFPVEVHDGYLGSLAQLARAVTALEAGDAQAAADQVASFRGRENLEFGMLFTVVHAVIELWRGAPEAGLESLESREGADRPRARLSAEDRRMVAAVRAMLHAASNRTGAALAELRALDRTDPVAAVLHAALLLQEQSPERVIERLSVVTAESGPRILAASSLLTASASLLRDDRELAAASLRRFLATAEVHGVTSPVLLIPAEHREQLWGFAHGIGIAADRIAALSSVPAVLHIASARPALTPREVEVLSRLRDTPSVPEIAAALNVSSNTVKTQVRTLYRKLEAANRDEALRAGHLHGLFRD